MNSSVCLIYREITINAEIDVIVLSLLIAIQIFALRYFARRIRHVEELYMGIVNKGYKH